MLLIGMDGGLAVLREGRSYMKGGNKKITKVIRNLLGQ
jgi:hypothetical protein